jgi:hypothetical protein
MKTMEMTRVEIFRAMQGTGIPNVKDAEGTIIVPVAFHTHQYNDQDGKEHAVLVIKSESGDLYKTEVQAFIKKFFAYDEAFGSLPDNEKPKICFTCKVSKKNNKYADFDVLDD